MIEIALNNAIWILASIVVAAAIVVAMYSCYKFVEDSVETFDESTHRDITIDLPKTNAYDLWNLVQTSWSGGFGDDYDQARQWLTAKLCQQGGDVHSSDIYLLRDTYHVTLPEKIWIQLYSLYVKGFRKYGFFHSTRDMSSWEAHRVIERFNDAQKPHYKETQHILEIGLGCQPKTCIS